MALWYSAEIEKIVPMYSNQLYFAITKYYKTVKLQNTVNVIYVNVDYEFTYQNFYNDFGPLNLSCAYKYCYKLNKYMNICNKQRRIVHYTSNNPNIKANCAFLIGAFCILYLNMSPKTVDRLLGRVGPFRPFLDASQTPNKYYLQLCDCFNAVQKAIVSNLFNFNDFNFMEYDTYDKLQYGGINWIIPRKFLAFVGPSDDQLVNGHCPEFYLSYFLKNDVKTVIRLNNCKYDAFAFTQAGIQHIDLIFPDGTTPPNNILIRFLNVVENAPAAIAVHCKAGLGRTGSLIGAYIIKHYKMNAKETIAWLRICRPGSVIGKQQEWLERLQNWLIDGGNCYRETVFGNPNVIPVHKYGIYSKLWPVKRQQIMQDARKKRHLAYFPLGKLIKSDKTSGDDVLSKMKTQCTKNRQNSVASSVCSVFDRQTKPNQGERLVAIKAFYSKKPNLFKNCEI